MQIMQRNQEDRALTSPRSRSSLDNLISTTTDSAEFAFGDHQEALSIWNHPLDIEVEENRSYIHSVAPVDENAGNISVRTSVETAPEESSRAASLEGQKAQSQPLPERYSPGVAQESDHLNQATLPIVPPPDYVVRGGVRLTSTGRPSHARKVAPNHVKRPRNAFILFRSHACLHGLVPRDLVVDHRHISRVVGNLWKSLPLDERRVWEDLAEKEKEDHRRMNPDYKYKPNSKSNDSKRRRRRPVPEIETANEERRCEVLANVLIKGGGIDQELLDKKVEEQKVKDEVEGRQRNVKKSRSPRRAGSRVTPHAQQQLQKISTRGAGQRHHSNHSEHVEGHDEQWPPDIPVDQPWESNARDAYSTPGLRDMLPPSYFHQDQNFLPDSYQLTPRSFGRLLFSPSKGVFDRHSYDIPVGDDNILPLPIPSPRTFASENARRGQQALWSHQSRLVFDAPLPPVSEPASNLVDLLNHEPAYSYSHLGEIAATSVEVPGAEEIPPLAFTFEPDQDVQYVLLTKEQAQDAGLVQSIREQGLGITFEMD